MINDYKKEEKILDKLEELKELKTAEKQYNPVEKGVENLIKACLEKKDGISSEMLEVFEELEKNYKLEDIYKIAFVLVSSSSDFMTTATSMLNGIKKSITEVRKEIGDIMLDDAAQTGITERSHHFHGFGDVKCSLRETPKVVDEDKVKQALANDIGLLPYLKIDKKSLIKLDNVDTINGMEMEKVITVTIRSDAK